MSYSKSPFDQGDNVRRYACPDSWQCGGVVETINGPLVYYDEIMAWVKANMSPNKPDLSYLDKGNDKS